jgi:mRNA interferase ChpB
MKRGFSRGDIVEITLDPAEGVEQKGRRPVLILSPTKWNQLTKIALVAPISQGAEWARDRGLAVSLAGTGTKTQGVVLWYHLSTKDLGAREPRFIERADKGLVQEVLARAETLLAEEE